MEFANKGFGGRRAANEPNFTESSENSNDEDLLSLCLIIDTEIVSL